jgi:flavin-dependent dehydrogenase
VRPASTPAGSLAESIPPSARKLLSELGVLGAVEQAGFQPNGGNTVWWADNGVRSEAFGDGDQGFHVDREGLENVLVAAAESVGVRVYDRATARSAKEGDGGWSIYCEAEGRQRLELRTPWVLDATGRHGLVARREGREPDRSTTTLALVRRYRLSDGGDAATATHTLVESYLDGWAWSVPLDHEVRCFTAMVDQRHQTLEGVDVAGMLDAELVKTRELAGVLAGSHPVGAAWACPASLYTARRFGRPGLLLVGDAGSFIDPLSSYGVKKALSSGWLAGVTAHTALIDSAMTQASVGFFDRRERDVYRSYRRVSARFFEEAARAYDHPYWITRAEAARAAGGGEPDDADVDPDRISPLPVPEADVRAAFDAIRSRERLDAIPGPTLRTLERPGIEGQRIVLADHVASDTYPEGLRFVRGVDLRRLVEIAPQHGDVPESWSAYNGVGGPGCPPP